MAENELRVNAYEAANRRFVGGRLHTGGQAYFEKLSDEPFDDTELFLSPGFIDMHVHLFDGYGIFGMHASLFGHRWGVHAMSDAGSCGFDNIDGFYKYIIPTYRGVTKPKLWIHVNRFGLPSNHESIDFSTLRPELAARAAREHAGDVVGIKVRLNCDIPEKDCLVPLDRALEAAVLAGLPLMVHISQGPPNCEDILPRLRKGDVVTHIFNGKPGSPWKADGSPSDELLDAQRRGVLFDVAHGFSSFNFNTCRGALEHGFRDVSVSTDMHKRCFAGKPFTFTDVMSKLYACGMTLEEIVWGATAKPAAMLGFDGWTDMDALCGHGTLFSFRENTEKRVFFDGFGNTAIPDKVFHAESVLVDGELIACDDVPPAVDLG